VRSQEVAIEPVHDREHLLARDVEDLPIRALELEDRADVLRLVGCPSVKSTKIVYWSSSVSVTRLPTSVPRAV
jgi:hypothetical protein